MRERWTRIAHRLRRANNENPLPCSERFFGKQIPHPLRMTPKLFRGLPKQVPIVRVSLEHSDFDETLKRNVIEDDLKREALGRGRLV